MPTKEIRLPYHKAMICNFGTVTYAGHAWLISTTIAECHSGTFLSKYHSVCEFLPLRNGSPTEYMR